MVIQARTLPQIRPLIWWDQNTTAAIAGNWTLQVALLDAGSLLAALFWLPLRFNAAMQLLLLTRDNASQSALCRDECI